jgi:hypothetical protein
MKLWLIAVLMVAGITRALAGADDSKAVQLADAVMKASGAEHWPKLRRIQFTFNVGQDDKLLFSAKHNWDVRAGKDTVSWKDKTVTVNISNPGSDEDSKAAHARWVNDSYWLLMPLKLRDPGVTVEYAGNQNGLEMLHLSFGNVGLTPGDRYNLYIDPDTHLVRRWDYMPSPDKNVTGTWEGYKEFGGLLLSTEHEFGGKRIWLSGISTETD